MKYGIIKNKKIISIEKTKQDIIEKYTKIQKKDPSCFIAEIDDKK